MSRKKIIFAPLEGVTGYIYRRTYEKYFGGIDTYYSPFVVTRDGGIMKNKELRDILPENNKTIALVPQILTNHAQNFIQASKQMAEIGYQEVNLNLGCPSGTVVSKGRGAGFLGKTVQLNRFLEEIFSNAACDISIKTRIGVEDAEEFEQILKIYNQYPVRLLTVHPRTRREFYKGTVHREVFQYAYENSKNPLCYNGDICTKAQYEQISADFPKIEAVMIGRGFLARPAFAGGICGEPKELTKARLLDFMCDLLEQYREVMSGEIHALFKMKELWIYMAPQFTNYEKYLKKIKKTNKIAEYQSVMNALFRNEELI